MAFDFGSEEKQREVQYGPVPDGSIVVVNMGIIEPKDDYQNGKRDPFITVAKSDLLYLYCLCEVDKGDYAGVQWRQSIMLPCAMQETSLSPSQEKACRIGGATLKAILQAAKKPSRSELSVFNGIRFPCKVRISNSPYEKEGKTHWKNEIAKVITPEMPEYAQIGKAGQLINERGSTEGKAANSHKAESNASYGSEDYGYKERRSEIDEVPFYRDST